MQNIFFNQMKKCLECLECAKVPKVFKGGSKILSRLFIHVSLRLNCEDI